MIHNQLENFLDQEKFDDEGFNDVMYDILHS